MSTDEYESIPKDTIDGMHRRLEYWEYRGKMIKADFKNSLAQKQTFPNYYIKGFLYFTLNDFLLWQIGGGGTSNEKEEFFEKSSDIRTEKFRKNIKVNKFNWDMKECAKIRKSFNINMPIYDQIQAHLYHMSLEYLFKAVEMHSNKCITPIHDLNKLFKKFPEKLQNEINLYCLETYKIENIGDWLNKSGNLDVDENRYYRKEKHYGTQTVCDLLTISKIFYRDIFPLGRFFSVEPKYDECQDEWTS